MLAAAVVMVFTRTVQADVPLSRPVATLPPAPPLASAPPALVAPLRSDGTQQADVLHGLASWYGTAFNGRRTASGERFDMYAMTACHPTLPFGSVVRVTNLNNQRSVEVRITDRGYLYRGRILDLSYEAARRLEMAKAGLAPVELEVLSLGQPRPRM